MEHDCSRLHAFFQKYYIFLPIQPQLKNIFDQSTFNTSLIVITAMFINETLKKYKKGNFVYNIGLKS